MTTTTTAVARTNHTFSSFMAGDTIKRKVGEIIAGKKGESFVTSIVASVSNNPALAACDNNTILSAGLQGAALDLSPAPSLGHFYMVPFEDRKNQRTVAQFLIGYKGYIQLAIRSGQYRRINVIALKEGELVSYNRLTEEIFTKLIDDDEIRDTLATTGYYCMFELNNGFIKTMYWSVAKMEQHAMRYSKGYAAKKCYTFWEKDFDGMAFKTMLRQILSKWGVMSIEMQRAYDSDMGVLDQDEPPDYIDNRVDDTPAEEPQKALPACPDETITKWVKTLAKGNVTAEDLIENGEKSYTLTENQKATLRGAVPSAEPIDETAPSLSFASVAESLNKAATLELLDDAAALIGEIADPGQRRELSAIYKKRQASFN